MYGINMKSLNVHLINVFAAISRNNVSNNIKFCCGSAHTVVCAVNYCNPRKHFTTVENQYITIVCTVSKGCGILLQLGVTVVCAVIYCNLKL